MLSRYVKSGELVRIGRGIYRGAHAPGLEDFRWEDLADVAARTRGGVVCLTSALAIYGLTEEIPRKHWIAIRNSTRHRDDSSVAVVRMRNMDLGRSEIRLGQVTIPVFDRERTIVDSFRYLSSEIAIKALKVAYSKRGAERVDFEKIRRYARVLRVKIEPYILAVTT
jgi:predicted transcriptional regulator of viral defense system